MKNDHSDLIEYLDNKFSKIDTKFDNLKNDFRKLQSSVDSYSYKADNYFQETTMLSGRLDRHEKWIKENSKK